MIKLLVFACVGSFSFLFGSLLQDENDPIKEKVIQNAVISILNQHHYSPEDLGDDFSEEAYDLFLEYIDSRKRYLTKEDLTQLEGYKYLIDDEIQSGSFEFFNKATDLLQARIDGVDELFSEILSSPFEFSSSEIIEFDPDKIDWSADDEQLADRWRKILKYDVLNKVASRLKKQEKALNEGKEDVEEKTVEEIEESSRERVLADYEKWYKRFTKVRRSDRFEAYLNAIAHIFDPHSDYYNPKEKEDFDIKMGGKLEGIGARLQSDGDLTKVVHIVPGGPAWKSKQIEVNDYITKVAQKDEEAIEIFGMRLDDVVTKIRGKKGTIVNLTIQKKDGSEIEVELERDVINTQETFAKSATLDYEGLIENVGYIDLPKFYSSFEGPEGNSCAADVAVEIDKLRKQNVNGIILDLRNNGGGSLKDVIDMSGLFIEDGPIVQVKPRQRKAYIYKDEDDDVHYNGPLIVLVNSNSASASEILAAAMQDYDRAVVVGSQSFGKGTVQRFIDLDRAVRGNSAIKPLGQVKLTMQKFYRINGGSTQLKGVEPDIILPHKYDLIEVGEREYPNALDWSELSPLEYTQDVYRVKHQAYLNKNSMQRISDNEKFDLIKEQAKWYEENKSKTSYSLHLEEYQEYLKYKKSRTDRFKKIMSDRIEALSINHLPEDADKINFDESTQAQHEDWVKKLNKDIYLEEAMAIMRDLIDVNSVTFLD